MNDAYIDTQQLLIQAHSEVQPIREEQLLNEETQQNLGPTRIRKTPAWMKDYVVKHC